MLNLKCCFLFYMWAGFKEKLIVGHRGCNHVKFNNTMKAFEEAIKRGVNMIEFDVRRTRDGVLIIHHDEDVDGMRIRGARYEDILDVGRKIGYEIPRLEDALKALEGRIWLDVELKEIGYETEVVNLILKYFTPVEFVMTSFNDSTILAIKSAFPAVTAGLIIGMNRQKMGRGVAFMRNWVKEVFPWPRFKACRADFLAINHRLVRWIGERAARTGVGLLVWTVNDRGERERFLAMEAVRAVATDCP